MQCIFRVSGEAKSAVKKRSAKLVNNFFFLFKFKLPFLEGPVQSGSIKMRQAAINLYVLDRTSDRSI